MRTGMQQSRRRWWCLQQRPRSANKDFDKLDLERFLLIAISAWQKSVTIYLAGNHKTNLFSSLSSTRPSCALVGRVKLTLVRLEENSDSWSYLGTTSLKKNVFFSALPKFPPSPPPYPRKKRFFREVVHSGSLKCLFLND